MDEKQSPTKLGELLQKQTSSVSDLPKTLAEKPKWAKEITLTYGSFINLCNKFSYANRNEFATEPIECFRRESPSFVRMDVTYGKGSAANWLYNILQGMFVFLGVTDDKFSKEQIYNLAKTIYANYKTLMVVEFLLFVSRFEAGKYGKFYGDTSYALTVTDALNKFMDERDRYLADIESMQRKINNERSTHNAISFEEYKRNKELRGERVSDALESIFGNKNLD